MTSNITINYAKNFPRNIITNIFSIIVNSLIGLLLVPFFLDTLGPSSYALIPLATTITSYVTLIIDVLNTAVARYLTIEMQRGDTEKANETYTTSFTLLAGFLILLIPIVFLVSFLAPVIFETGTISDTEVTIFFTLILSSILISTLRSNFMAILFAHNRLDLRNCVTITQSILQVGFILILFYIFSPSLTIVGTAYVLAALLALFLAYIFAKKQTNEIKYKLSSFNKHRIRELTGLSVYLLVDRLGYMMQGQIAIIIVNIYFGAIAQAEYSFVITWCGFLTMLVGVLSSTVAPKIYSLIAVENDAEAVKFTARFTKIIGLLVALPVALLCIFAPQIMTLWVGAEYSSLAPLVWILIPVAYFSTTLSVQVPLAISKNKMKFPAYLNIIAAVIYLIMALTSPLIFNNGYYGVAISYAIIIIIHHGIISPIYYAWIVNAPATTFIKKSLPGFIAMIILMMIGLMYTTVINVNQIPILFTSIVGITIFYLGVLIVKIFTAEEKKLAKSCLPSRIQNMKVIEAILGK